MRGGAGLLGARPWAVLARRPARLLSDHVVVDRSALPDQIPEYSGRFSTALEQEIYRTVSILGPMTIATYMRRALLHPTLGYYTNRDAFGAKGDFTTSPEIIQVFGEMIGVWMTTAFKALGCPDRISLVELGPGRGTMMSDIIRTMLKLGAKPDIHLVEQSPLLKRLQADALQPLVDARGVRIRWHDRLASFDPEPNEPVLIVAHEFLDALPIHQFQFTAQGWRERLVAARLQPGADQPLQVVLAPQPTPACQLIERVRRPPLPEIGAVLEISPESIAVVDQICSRLATNRGAALIVDYGADRPAPDTLRAVHDHRFVPFLRRPGQVDITADVNFGALREAVQSWEGTVKASATVEQGRFLQAMGIMERVQHLVDRAGSEHDEEALISGYERLVDPDQMGSVYKCMAIASADLCQHLPAVQFPQQQHDDLHE